MLFQIPYTTHILCFACKHQKEKQLRAGSAASPSRPGDSTLNLPSTGAGTPGQRTGSTELLVLQNQHRPTPGLLPGAGAILLQGPRSSGSHLLQTQQPPRRSPRLLSGVFRTRTHLPAAKKPQGCRPGALELEIHQDPSTARASVPPATHTIGISAAAPVGAGSAPGADGGAENSSKPELLE